MISIYATHIHIHTHAHAHGRSPQRGNAAAGARSLILDQRCLFSKNFRPTYDRDERSDPVACGLSHDATRQRAAYRFTLMNRRIRRGPSCVRTRDFFFFFTIYDTSLHPRAIISFRHPRMSPVTSVFCSRSAVARHIDGRPFRLASLRRRSPGNFDAAVQLNPRFRSSVNFEIFKFLELAKYSWSIKARITLPLVIIDPSL